MGWVELAHDLHTAHQEFMQVAGQLPSTLREAKGVCGDEWSPKDVVAHLIGWDQAAVCFLGLFSIGLGDTFNPDIDGDTFNANSVNMREGSSWDEVIAELTTTHDDLQHIITVLAAHQLKSDGGYGHSLIGRKDDYLFHTQQLRAWLPS